MPTRWAGAMRPIEIAEAFSADRDVVFDLRNAGSAPGCALSDLALVPSINPSAERHFVAVEGDRDPGGVEIRLALEGVFNSIADIARSRSPIDLDMVHDADHA